MYYDPQGNVIRSVNPDKSEQWVVHGVPIALGNVEVNNHWDFKGYVPTPWETYTYDSNDLALLTNGVSFGHDFTATRVVVDTLGKTVKTQACQAHINIDKSREDVVMSYAYDIRGNLLNVIDALGRKVFDHCYDLRPQPKDESEKLAPLRTLHIDSGSKQAVLDKSGKAIQVVDAKEAWVLSGYDNLNRAVNIWSKDNSASVISLRQHLQYGDSPALINAIENNCRGRVYRHYDEAGMLQINKYSLSGNVTEKNRQVVSDATILSVFGSVTINCYRVNWQGLNHSLLDSKIYATNTEYDACGRITKLIYPEDVEGKRRVLNPAYSNAGTLQQVTLQSDILALPVTFVTHIAYNAKGQRILAAHGNGVITRYSYDKYGYRLKRLRSEICTLNAWQFTGSGSLKQDIVFEYDLAGNIISTLQNTTSCGVGGANQLLRTFEYDPLYRLISADGRENSPTITPIWDDSYRSEDYSITTAYKQNYTYDKMGNILSLQHIGAANFTRVFNPDTGGNIVQQYGATNFMNKIKVGSTTFDYSYDSCGNMLSETSNRIFEWDAADRMRSFYVVASGNISQYTHYLYDAEGNRVKKISRKQNGDYDSVTYIDSIYEYKTDGSGEQNTLHIVDHTRRVAVIRLGASFGDLTPGIKYNLEDHLNSSAGQLEANGAWINQEEYFPFGETSFGSYAKKRYKYCGKERDEESGFYYYGARYYNAYTCRFINTDPLKAVYSNYASFVYASNKPIVSGDHNGLGPDNDTSKPAESTQTDSTTNGKGGSSAATKTDSKTDKLETKLTGTKNVVILIADEKDVQPEKHTLGNKDVNKNWDYIVVPKDKFDQVDEILANYAAQFGKIENLAIRSHGGGRLPEGYANHINLGEESFTYTKIDSYFYDNKDSAVAETLQNISKSLSKNATILFGACGVGKDFYLCLGVALLLDVQNTDRTVLFNRTLSCRNNFMDLGKGLINDSDLSGGFGYINKAQCAKMKDPLAVKDIVKNTDKGDFKLNVKLNPTGKPLEFFYTTPIPSTTQTPIFHGF